MNPIQPFEDHTPRAYKYLNKAPQQSLFTRRHKITRPCPGCVRDEARLAHRTNPRRRIPFVARGGDRFETSCVCKSSVQRAPASSQIQPSGTRRAAKGAQRAALFVGGHPAPLWVGQRESSSHYQGVGYQWSTAARERVFRAPNPPRDTPSGRLATRRNAVALFHYRPQSGALTTTCTTL